MQPAPASPTEVDAGRNFAIMSTSNGNVRRRAECESRRDEAMALRMRLRFPRQTTHSIIRRDSVTMPYVWPIWDSHISN